MSVITSYPTPSVRGAKYPHIPTAAVPITGHHIQWIGSFSNRSSMPYVIRVTATLAIPISAPMSTYSASAAPEGAKTSGIAKAACAPSNAIRIPAAAVVASATGISDRGRSSNKSNSTASSTPDTGAPNVADIPAAAPAASSVFRSSAVTACSCPKSDPSAPPVAMIGPSAPNGPPVPIEIAADKGLSSVTRAGIRLSSDNTFSIVSGIPCPRMARDPYRAMSPTISSAHHRNTDNPKPKVVVRRRMVFK